MISNGKLHSFYRNSVFKCWNENPIDIREVRFLLLVFVIGLDNNMSFDCGHAARDRKSYAHYANDSADFRTAGTGGCIIHLLLAPSQLDAVRVPIKRTIIISNKIYIILYIMILQTADPFGAYNILSLADYAYIYNISLRNP